MPTTEPTTWEFIETFMSQGGYSTLNESDEWVNTPGLLMAAPTPYLLLCNLDYAPGAIAAYQRWRNVRTTASLVAGLATFPWPDPATLETENRTSIVRFTADVGVAAVTFEVPKITDVGILAGGIKSHILKIQILNNSLASLPTGKAADSVSNIPMRYLAGTAATNCPHGQVIEYEIETDGNTVAYVRNVKILGDTIPPVWAIVDEGRGANASVITQISGASFNPDMNEGEPMLLFMGRNTGTAVVLPTGRGWAFPADQNGLVSGGTLDAALSGLRVAVSTIRGAAGVVDGTNTMSNQQMLDVVAFRGAMPVSYWGVTTLGDTVNFQNFTGVAPGGFAYYLTWANAATGVVPAGGLPVHPVGDAPTTNGWSARARMVLADENGVIDPPDVVLAGAAKVHMIAVLMEPV